MRHNRHMPDYPQAEAGATIRQRRIALGFTSMEAFAEAAGSSSRMVADAERGIPVGEKTRIRLSRAAKWTDDSIDRLYRGEQPIEHDPVAARTKPADEPPIDGGLGILTARMAQLRKKLDLIPDVWDQHGPEAARAAIANLSGQMRELQQQIAAAEFDPGQTSTGHAS
jgi:transcriptional regulator with XRE-family HTH domain